MPTYQNIFVEMSRHMAQDHVSQLIHSSFQLHGGLSAFIIKLSVFQQQKHVLIRASQLLGGLFFSKNLKYGPKYAFAFFGSFSFLFNTGHVVHEKHGSTALAENLD